MKKNEKNASNIKIDKKRFLPFGKREHGSYPKITPSIGKIQNFIFLKNRPKNLLRIRI